MRGRFNFEYLRPLGEAPLLMRFALRHIFTRKPQEGAPAILLINTCIIGEFAASVPAIRDFIERHESSAVDLVVSPPLQEIAKHIRGIRHVFTARSIYGRSLERSVNEEKVPDAAYAHIVAMRISPNAYALTKGIGAQRISVGAGSFARYGMHLLYCYLRRLTPRSWRDVSFEMLGGTPRSMAFDEMFDIGPSSLERIEMLPPLRQSRPTVVIHTGASWIMNKWNNTHWITLLQELAKKASYQFIFIGSNELEQKDYEEISESLPAQTYSLIGKLSLLELMLLLRKSDFFIGIDSGPRNLAHIADTRSLVLLGPGPHMFTPPNERGLVLDVSHGRGWRQRFIRGSEKLIDRITPDMAANAFHALNHGVQ